MTTLTKEAAKEAATAAAWTEEDTGRRVLHSFLGPFGADHDLEGVLAEIDDAVEVAWRWNIFDHDLAVTNQQGKTYYFDVKQPKDAE